MDGDAALCVRRSAQQSHGPWFCSAVTLWTIGRRSPTLHVAPAVGSQCCRSVWVEGGGVGVVVVGEVKGGAVVGM